MAVGCSGVFSGERGHRRGTDPRLSRSLITAGCIDHAVTRSALARAAEAGDWCSRRDGAAPTHPKVPHLLALRAPLTTVYPIGSVTCRGLVHNPQGEVEWLSRAGPYVRSSFMAEWEATCWTMKSSFPGSQRFRGTQPGFRLAQDLVLAIEKSVTTTSGFHFRFVSGNPNEVPLLYVEETGETITEEVSVGRWRAVATRVAVHPSNRLLAIEMRRASVGATNLQRYFSRLAKDNDYYSRLSLDINSLPSPSFAVELEEFERIREASIVVRRPNTDWDDADDVLSQLADDSFGHQASVTVNASRGQKFGAEPRDHGVDLPAHRSPSCQRG